MRLLLPAPGFPPLFYEINLSEGLHRSPSRALTTATASLQKPMCAPTASSA